MKLSDVVGYHLIGGANDYENPCWLNIDKYKRKQVNKYLKLYAKNDDRWQEAFDEVLYL